MFHAFPFAAVIDHKRGISALDEQFENIFVDTLRAVGKYKHGLGGRVLLLACKNAEPFYSARARFPAVESNFFVHYPVDDLFARNLRVEIGGIVKFVPQSRRC